MKTTFLALSIFLLSGLTSGIAMAQSCTEGAVLVETVESGNTITYFCECKDGYEPEGDKCVKAQPEPVDDLVDPRWLRDGDAAIEARLAALKKQRAFLEKELDKLKTIEGGMQQLVAENETASRELLQDAQAQSVDVLDGLLSMAPLPPSIKPGVETAIAGSQALLALRDHGTTENKVRAEEKLIDHTTYLKNIFITNSSLFKVAEIGPFKALTDGSMKVHKILQRRQQPGVNSTIFRADLEDAHGVLIDVIQALAPPAGSLLKATNSLVGVKQAQYALGRLENDRDEMQEAFQNNRTAVRYYEGRLEKLANDEAFYRAELGQQP